jgi:predicted patatin/cPLA2 family phospholipase
MEVSFEKEAYANESNLKYLKRRRFFAFLKYLKK